MYKCENPVVCHMLSFISKSLAAVCAAGWNTGVAGDISQISAALYDYLLPHFLGESQRNNVRAKCVRMWRVSRAAVMSPLSDDSLDPVTAHQSTSYTATRPHVSTHTCTHIHMCGQRFTLSDTSVCGWRLRKTMQKRNSPDSQMTHYLLTHTHKHTLTR